MENFGKLTIFTTTSEISFAVLLLCYSQPYDYNSGLYTGLYTVQPTGYMQDLLY